MALIFTADHLTDWDCFASLAEGETVTVYEVNDCYTGAHYRSQFKGSTVYILAAEDEDAAIETFCEIAGISDWNFYNTSCSCCSPVNFRISAWPYDRNELERLLRDESYAFIADR